MLRLDPWTALVLKLTDSTWFLSKWKVATFHRIVTYYIGNYDIITCEIVELECCPCGYEWCACQLRRGWGPAGAPHSPHTGPATAQGGYLDFTTQLLFIKHESTVMFQNTEDCGACSAGSTVAMVTSPVSSFCCCCFYIKKLYIYIYMCITFIRLLYFQKTLLSFLP